MVRAWRDTALWAQVIHCFESITVAHRADGHLRSDPLNTIRTGEGFEVEGDPLVALEKELEQYRFVKLPDISTFTGMVTLFAARSS